MAEPIISPDGKFMWTGSEWIPTPPSGNIENKQSIIVQDSVIAGDFVSNTVYNDSESISRAVIEALDHVGLTSGTHGMISKEQQQQINDITAMVDTAETEGLELSFDALYELARAAMMILDFELSNKHLWKMVEISQSNNDTLHEYWARVCLIISSLGFDDGSEEVDLSAAENIANEALSLSKKHTNLRMEGDTWQLLMILESIKGNPATAVEMVLAQLPIWNELGDMDEIIGCHICLCGLYSDLKLHDKAKLHLDVAHHLVEVATDSPMMEILFGMTKIMHLMVVGNGLPPEQFNQTKEEILEIANNCVDIMNSNQIPHGGADLMILELEKQVGIKWFN